MPYSPSHYICRIFAVWQYSHHKTFQFLPIIFIPTTAPWVKKPEAAQSQELPPSQTRHGAPLP